MTSATPTPARDELSFFDDLSAQRQAELAGWATALVEETAKAVRQADRNALVEQMRELKGDPNPSNANPFGVQQGWVNQGIDQCLALLTNTSNTEQP